MSLEPLPTFKARIVSGVGELAEAEWTGCFPREVEGWHYYRACERAMGMQAFAAAAEVRDEKGLLIAAPLFKMSYRLDTPLQGALGRFGARVTALFPNLLEWRLLGVGSPYADRCHIAIRPGLSQLAKLQAMRALITLVENEGHRIGAPLIAYKDLSGEEYALIGASLRQHCYAEVSSLPVAALRIPKDSVDAYLGRLSQSTRRDVRRKLRSVRNITVERRTDLNGIAGKITALYESTRKNSDARYGEFEELPGGYFEAVSQELQGRALFMLYWIDGQLAAFNLLLLEPDRVIDKFLGMSYPLARENNLYTVSWIENVRFCLETGRTSLQSGQTAYRSKIRLGSELVPSWNLVRHRSPVLNRMIGWAAPLIAFDRWDPELKQLKSTGRIR